MADPADDGNEDEPVDLELELEDEADVASPELDLEMVPEEEE